DADGNGDEFVLADHPIDDEVAAIRGPPGAGLPGRRKRHAGEYRSLRLLEREIAGRVRGGGYHGERDQRRPSTCCHVLLPQNVYPAFSRKRNFSKSLSRV